MSPNIHGSYVPKHKGDMDPNNQYCVEKNIERKTSSDLFPVEQEYKTSIDDIRYVLNCNSCHMIRSRWFYHTDQGLLHLL